MPQAPGDIEGSNAIPKDTWQVRASTPTPPAPPTAAPTTSASTSASPPHLSLLPRIHMAGQPRALPARAALGARRVGPHHSSLPRADCLLRHPLHCRGRPPPETGRLLRGGSAPRPLHQRAGDAIAGRASAPLQHSSPWRTDEWASFATHVLLSSRQAPPSSRSPSCSSSFSPSDRWTSLT